LVGGEMARGRTASNKLAGVNSFTIQSISVADTRALVPLRLRLVIRRSRSHSLYWSPTTSSNWPEVPYDAATAVLAVQSRG
jgi:hypothetical protein